MTKSTETVDLYVPTKYATVNIEKNVLSLRVNEDTAYDLYHELKEFLLYRK